MSGDLVSEWRLRLATIVWFLLIVGWLLALPVIIDASWVLVAAAFLVALLVGAVGMVVRRMVIGAPSAGSVRVWATASSAAFLTLCIAMAAPIYYFAIGTAADPALLPRVVISNGDKTVILQGMMHIGTERFYKQVVYDAEAALADGYVLYYEGVQPDPAGDQWFSDNLAGGGDLSANYQKIGEICGLEFQLTYFDLLIKDFEAHPEVHVMADVSTLEMKQEYERLLQTDSEFAAEVGSEQEDAAQAGSGMAGLIDWLQGGTEGQKKLAGYVCRWMMSRVAHGEAAPRQLDKVVLDFRNRKLVERILADPHRRIYITYGAHHLQGVMRLLKHHDPRWSVESVSWIQPVEAPVQLEGELQI